MLVLAILAPLVAPYGFDVDRSRASPRRAVARRTGSAPTRSGRDLFTRVIYGARVSLAIGIVSARDERGRSA